MVTGYVAKFLKASRSLFQFLRIAATYLAFDQSLKHLLVLLHNFFGNVLSVVVSESDKVLARLDAEFGIVYVLIDGVVLTDFVSVENLQRPWGHS
jgi:hypothetical protein